MDPETVETLVLLGKFILIMGGGCAAVMGSLYALVAGTVHYRCTLREGSRRSRQSLMRTAFQSMKHDPTTGDHL
jgi:hypothetical protein